MDIDFAKMKQAENIIQQVLPNKEQVLLDLMNVEENLTGRVDAMFTNGFQREAVQMIINAISLFESGYFDAAFYSLRQSLEISTTSVFFIDDASDMEIKNRLNKWKAQDNFPAIGKMMKELKERRNTFADMHTHMATYFLYINDIKAKLNKYVHKQGFETFYTGVHSMKLQEYREIQRMNDFREFLRCSIGAVAVLRLAIDPFPVLLGDKDIYNRTSQFMSNGYSREFIVEYIGVSNIDDYKKTEFYKAHYEALITNELMNPAILEIVKNEFIDRTKQYEIISQTHLLSLPERIAVAFTFFSQKIAKIYWGIGFVWWFTDIKSTRKKLDFNSDDLSRVKNGLIYNSEYDGAYLSYIKLADDDFYIEHNSSFTDEEIAELEAVKIIIEQTNS